MKKLIFISAIALILASCQVASFTMVSTKNVPTTEGCVLLKRNAVVKSFDIETGIDKCIELSDSGLYLTNVVIYQRFYRFKIKGDVWGK
jgi:hypothetical protein